MTLTPDIWADNLELLDRQGRLVQGSWNGDDGPRDPGHALACFLSAAEPGGKIDRDEKVPCGALCMPEWMAPLIRTLFDGVADVHGFVARSTPVIRKWCVLDEAAWDRVSVEIRVASIGLALEAAEACQPTPRPGYWDAVYDACGQMVSALRSGESAEAAGAAAKAAKAAGAAGAAAWAAEAAGGAEAAVWGAWAVWAAKAAGAAAYQRLFETLMTLIEREIEAATGDQHG